ncbi:hypothetical protein ECZU20_54330 [Escherichia coli]|nr:hypothetical protein ECZU20_54330 [Escherichia coli]
MTEPLNLRTDVVRQHTVPRFLLKHFSKPVKGKRQRLHAFDKAAGRAYATTPDDATVRNTFYNFDNHPQRFSLEPLLGITNMTRHRSLPAYWSIRTFAG